MSIGQTPKIKRFQIRLAGFFANCQQNDRAYLIFNAYKMPVPYRLRGINAAIRRYFKSIRRFNFWNECQIFTFVKY